MKFPVRASLNLTSQNCSHLLQSISQYYIYTTSGAIMLPLLLVQQIILYICHGIYEIFSGCIQEPDSLEPLPPPLYISLFYLYNLRSSYALPLSCSKNLFTCIL